MLTIVTAFGPGRDWLVDFFATNLAAASLSWPTVELVVTDNTGTATVRTRLADRLPPLARTIWLLPNVGSDLRAATSSGPSLASEQPQCGRRPPDADSSGPSPARPSASAISHHLAVTWNRAIPCTTGARILSWEPDVAPAPGDLDRLLAAPPDALVGTPVPARGNGHLMVYRAATLVPWRLDKRHSYRGASGLQPVHSVSLGLTMIPGDWLRRRHFLPHANTDGTGYAAHDIWLSRAALLTGVPVLCHFACRPRHHRSPTEARVWTISAGGGTDRPPAQDVRSGVA